MPNNTQNAAQMREQSIEELELRLNEAKKELFGLRVKATTKELTDPTQIRFKRREIARITTILGQKRLAAQQAQG